MNKYYFIIARINLYTGVILLFSIGNSQYYKLKQF